MKEFQKNGHDSDVDVLALRYVTGEMSSADIDSFEARLADDQSARESVSRIVLVGAAVVRRETGRPGEAAPAAFPPAATDRATDRAIDAVANRPMRSTRRRVAAAAALLVVAAGAAVGYGIYSRGAGSGDGVRGSDGDQVASSEVVDEAYDLVASWVEYGGELAIDGIELGDAGETPGEANQEDNGGVMLDTGEAPAWLVRALAKKD